MQVRSHTNFFNNSFFKKVIILLLFLSQSGLASAYHLIGGELYYECLGLDPNNPGNQLYRLILKIYRDCAGGGQDFDSLPNGPAIGTVTVYRGNDPTPFITTIEIPAPDVIFLEPDAGNPCLVVPPNLCVQEGVYEFIQSLPISDESYYITYQRCCRNATINNIYDAFETGATYTIELTPTAQTSCNNSPTFNNFPPIVICVGQNINFDHSAFDQEGDQLIFTFCSPLKGGGLYGGGLAGDGLYPDPDLPPPYDGVDFVLPDYNELAPLGGNPVVSIDPQTGLITGIPEIQGQFVVGICVEEYRNGELLSTIQRDFQFNVAYCEPVVVADLIGEPVDDLYTYESCGETSFFIENLSYQQQFIESYLWEIQVDGQTQTFDSQDLSIDFPGPGYYPGQLIINPNTQCTDTAKMAFNVAAPPMADFSFEYDTCVVEPVIFTDLSQPGTYPVEDWEWQFGDGRDTSLVSPDHLYAEPGDYSVQLTITDEIGCVDSLSQMLSWYPAPPLIVVEPSSFLGCPPVDIYFNNLTAPIDDTYEIIWDFGDGGVSDAISPSYTYTRPGTYSIELEITSPIGCTIERSYPNWIFVDSLPVANFNFPRTPFSNFEPTIAFQDASIRAVEWDWRFGDFGSSIVQHPEFTFPDTGEVEVELIVTHLYGCHDTLVQRIDIEPLITYYLPNAFTPNGDGKNEFFGAAGFFRGIRNYEMIIFNRWGEVVFASQSPEDAWNGQKNNSGNLAPSGVYPYVVNFNGPRGQPHQYRGFVTLLK